MTKAVRIILLLLLGIILILLLSGDRPFAEKRGLSLQVVGSAKEPLWASRAPGEEGLYVAEQTGRIVRTNGDVWMDITGKVLSGGEQGLLSFAFHPQYESNGLFYLYYTARNGDQVVAEGMGSDEGGQWVREVLRMKDFASNHNGGQVSFGPGGLYIATGDGGGAGDPRRTSQNPRSLLGKILRINPLQSGTRSYTIPADNPFRGQKGKRPEIFSLGLRNPWRFSFARGRIWIGDVGQDSQEEISAPSLRRARGGNFGWSAWEGRKRYNRDQRARDPIWPLLTYGRKAGCSVTGGHYMSSGTLRGRYVYSDFCRGQLRSFRLQNGRARGDRSEGLRVPYPVSFTRGSNGELWAVSLLGKIYRIR